MKIFTKRYAMAYVALTLYVIVCALLTMENFSSKGESLGLTIFTVAYAFIGLYVLYIMFHKAFIQNH